MTDGEGLGRRVRRLRQAAGMSQQELAGAEFSASYISLIEAGRRAPGQTVLDTLAARLGVTAAYLVTGADLRPESEVMLDLRYAELTLLSGDPAEAQRRFAELVDSLDPERQRTLWRSAAHGLGLALERLGEVAEALRLQEQVLARTTVDDTYPNYVMTVARLARAYLVAGDLGHALRLFEDAAALLDSLGNPCGPEEAVLLTGQIWAYLETGDLARAAVLSERALERTRGSGNRTAESEAFLTASKLAQEQGHTGLAVEYAERAVAVAAEADNDRHTAMHRINLAFLTLQADPSAGRAVLAMLAPVLAMLEEQGDELPLAYGRMEVARAHLMLGELEEAAAAAARAETTLAASADVRQRAGVLVLMGEIAVTAGDVDRAHWLVAEVTAAALTLPPRRGVAKLWASVAEQHAALGNLEGQVEAQRHALRCLAVTPLVLARPAVLPGRQPR